MTRDAPRQPLPRPRKRFGQNFLIDQNIVRKIVALAQVGPADLVLEIGPGRGILTRELCRHAQRVVGIEIDRDLHAFLTSELGACHNLDLRLGDALEFEYGSLPQGTVVVANLPYYVSTPLLFKLIEARTSISRMILMLQLEVAKRLVAKPDTSEYGVLSVLTQCWTVPSLAFKVPPTAFRPRPEVSSAVVSLSVGATQQVPQVWREDEAQFARTVRAAFAYRRKTLANSLRQSGFPAKAIADALDATGISPSRRAETLAIRDFAALAKALCSPDYSPGGS